MEQELKRFPTIQSTIAGSANESLEKFREESKHPQEVEKAGNPRGNQRESSPAAQNIDRYAEAHVRRIGSNVSSYDYMISETLKNTIAKAVVYCQVKVYSITSTPNWEERDICSTL